MTNAQRDQHREANIEKTPAIADEAADGPVAWTYNQVALIVADVKFRDWLLKLFHRDGRGYLLQVVFRDERGTVWKGRKWYVSAHATRSEIVQTCLKAVLTACEHEARESFRYRGEAIFGPHHDVEALRGIAQAKRLTPTKEIP